MMGQLLLLSFVLQLSLILRTEAGDQEHPFVAVWNTPSKKCQKDHGIVLPTDEYGIIKNEEEEFYGDKVVLFYHKKLGRYPYLTEDEEPINGGIPQETDFDEHFKQAEADITAAIPNKDFDGYAVIDWEEWRPIYDRNWGAKKSYKRLSRAKVEAKHPLWSDEEIEEQARADFETYARLLMEGTLELGKTMRPKGKWGFYLFPSCYNYKGESMNCTAKNIENNDKLSWLWKASTALYPSNYLPRDNDIESNRIYVYTMTNEALRVREKFSSPNTPLLMYTRYTKVGEDIYYTKEEYEATIEMAADQGYNGVIIWGASNNTNDKTKCQSLQDHMYEILAPFTWGVLYHTSACSIEKCSGNGRCYKKNPLGISGDPLDYSENSVRKRANFQNFMREDVALPIKERVKPAHLFKGRSGNVLGRNHASRRWNPETRNMEYSCQCFSGWDGKSCSEMSNNVVKTK